MSISHDSYIACSKCKREQLFTIWDSVNVWVDPNLKQSLLDGDLTTFHCRRCGHSAHVANDLLYHDMKNQLAIWLKHSDGAGFAGLDTATKSLLSSLGKNYTCRIVESYHELVDKIRVFDDGFSDASIELFKLMISIRDGIDLSRPFYYATLQSSWFKGKSLVFAVANEHEFLELRYPIQHFNDAVDSVLPSIASLLRKTCEDWPKVDRQLLLTTMEEAGLMCPVAVKPGKSEIEAAAEFVLSIIQQTQADLPIVCSTLEFFDPIFSSLSADTFAAYEFNLAVISTQLHALPNFFPLEISSRIRSHVLNSIAIDDVGNYPVCTIGEYDSVWELAIEHAELPHAGVASILYDKLGLSASVSIGGQKLKDPMLISSLGCAVLSCGSGWWKKWTEKYQLERFSI